MKINPIGICSWSLRNNGEMIDRTMEKTGLSCLHLDVLAADELACLISEQEWKVTSTMVSFPQEDYSSLDTIRLTGGIVPDDSWEQNREIVMDAIEKTVALRVPYLTTHAGFIDRHNVEKYRKFMVRIRELADVALEKGIMLLMETGQESAVDLRLCLEELDHPAIGVNFDPANMILYGKGDPIQAVRTLAPWIKHLHIKDATASPVPGTWGAEVPWGEGEVDHNAFFNALDEIGFSGALAIEREAGNTRQDDICLAVERIGVYA